jgi:hypothetical protein
MKNETWWMKHTIIRDEMNVVPEDNIPKLIAEAQRRERDRIKALLLASGHGGGNWRRLIEQS